MTRTTPLPRPEIDAAVAAERLALADLVAPLDDAAWSTPSLCAAWTVRDVVAHLTVTTRVRVPGVLVAAARNGFDFDRMEIALAADRAGRFTPAELVDQLRESAASSRRFPMSGPMDPLMDLVIHAQDVARPLGVPYSSPPQVVSASLAYVAANRFLGGPARVEGVRLVSATTGWSTGDGPAVTGPDTDLLLAVSGRPAGLAGLDGPGLDRFAARVGG